MVIITFILLGSIVVFGYMYLNKVLTLRDEVEKTILVADTIRSGLSLNKLREAMYLNNKVKDFREHLANIYNLDKHRQIESDIREFRRVIEKNNQDIWLRITKELYLNKNKKRSKIWNK